MNEPRLVVGDGNLGLWSALRNVFPRAEEQRCWNHRMVNVLTQVPKQRQGEARKLLTKIPYQESERQTRQKKRVFQNWCLGHSHERDAELIDENWEQMVTFYRFPRGRWRHLRTTNVIESPPAASASAPWRIILRHVFPNALSPIVIATTLDIAQAIITESALSFLDLGFPSDFPTRGRLLYDGVPFLTLTPDRVIWPGLAISLTVLSVNFLGDGLRDALDPHATATTVRRTRRPGNLQRPARPGGLCFDRQRLVPDAGHRVRQSRILYDAGWVRGRCGIRAKDGVRLSILYQTSINSVRQGTQALIKQMWSEIGVETELRNINASVFFGSDPASPDTYHKFYADIQMYTNNFDGTDPQAYMAGWVCDKIPGPENQWNGTNISRYCNPEYDALAAEFAETGGIERRAAIIKRMNDMLIGDGAMIPLIHHGEVAARLLTLDGMRHNAWDATLWNVHEWRRIK